MRTTCVAGESPTSTDNPSQGIPSPPLSPPLSAVTPVDTAKGSAGPPRSLSKARRGGAAYTITGECERLFCETLQAIFLGEGKLAMQDSLVMGVRNNLERLQGREYGYDSGHSVQQPVLPLHLSPAPDGFTEPRGLVKQWVEVWDYAGGAHFRGFVASDEDERALFVFFDNGVIGNDLKPG